MNYSIFSNVDSLPPTNLVKIDFEKSLVYVL